MEIKDLLLVTMVKLYRASAQRPQLQRPQPVSLTEIALILHREGKIRFIKFPFPEGTGVARQRTPTEKLADDRTSASLMESAEELHTQGLITSNTTPIQWASQFVPTEQGLAEADWLIRPWYRKAFDAVKGTERLSL